MHAPRTSISTLAAALLSGLLLASTAAAQPATPHLDALIAELDLVAPFA